MRHCEMTLGVYCTQSCLGSRKEGATPKMQRRANGPSKKNPTSQSRVIIPELYGTTRSSKAKLGIPGHPCSASLFEPSLSPPRWMCYQNKLRRPEGAS